MSLETAHIDLNDCRKRVLAGETLSLEEARAVFTALRENRTLAATTAAAKREKRDASAIAAQDLSDLDSLLGI